LIELLVVIAIIGILSGLIVVSMSGVTQKANIAKAQVFSSSLRNSLMLNLVSEWKLNETTGTTTINSWGSNTASLNNFSFDTTDGWRLDSQCITGNCLFFDGVNDFVNTAKAYGGDGSGTVELWANVNAVTGNAMRFITFGNSGSDYFGLYLFTDNRLRVKYYDGDHKVFSTSKTINLNIWYHVVATWVQNQYMNVYVDGIRVLNNTTILGTSTFGSDSAGSVRFGYPANEDLSHGYYKGFLDNVRIYNAPMPTSQIKVNYYAGLNKLFVSGGISKEEYIARINEVINSVAEAK
jgi:type II secretory pathway pseudopilin PulG